MTDSGASSSNAGGPEVDRRKNTDPEGYFNAQFEAKPVYVDMGGTSCTDDQHEMLVSTVGSGVLMTCYDQELGLGLMSSIILPEEILDVFPFLDRAEPAVVEKAFKPLNDAIQEMKSRGAGKNRIRIRLFGGVIRDGDDADRGLKNTVFVQEYLFRKGLQVFNADVGGPFIRRVHFFPTTGRAVRRLLKREDDFSDLESQERDFNKNITSGT